MIKVKEKFYQRLRDDATIRTLLGITTPGGDDGHIAWNYLPDNPVFPMLVYWEGASKAENRFRGIQTITDLFYDLEIYDEAPDSTKIENIKDRVMQLFQDTHESLSDQYVNFFVSEVTDGGGDAFTIVDNRWYGKLRIHFKVQSVAEIISEQH